jgi:hypothetical protein
MRVGRTAPLSEFLPDLTLRLTNKILFHLRKLIRWNKGKDSPVKVFYGKAE